MKLARKRATKVFGRIQAKQTMEELIGKLRYISSPEFLAIMKERIREQVNKAFEINEEDYKEGV